MEGTVIYESGLRATGRLSCTRAMSCVGVQEEQQYRVCEFFDQLFEPNGPSCCDEGECQPSSGGVSGGNTKDPHSTGPSCTP